MRGHHGVRKAPRHLKNKETSTPADGGSYHRLGGRHSAANRKNGPDCEGFAFDLLRQTGTNVLVNQSKDSHVRVISDTLAWDQEKKSTGHFAHLQHSPLHGHCIHAQVRHLAFVCNSVPMHCNASALNHRADVVAENSTP